MKKTILVVLLVLLAFTMWSVLAFGKAKKGEEAKQPVEIEKAEPGPAPEDFPEVVLPKAHPARPTAEDYQTALDKKGKTPEQMKELQGEAVPMEFESQPQKAPYYCEVRNQVGGAYYRPGGDWNLYCWGQLGLATLLNLDNNYWTDCPYPLYPFEITEVAVQMYADDTCTFWSSGRIYDVDYTFDTYPNAQICAGGPQMDNHPGAFLWIIIPVDPPCCVYDEFFVAWMFDNSNDYQDLDYCDPIYFANLSLIFDASGRTGQSYWGPYAEYTGEPYYGWFDVVPNGIWPGALRIEVLGYTADQNECPPPVDPWTYKEGMPDFSQYNEAFPNNGAAYCGPTAGANSIWWFSCVQDEFPPSWGGCLEGDEIALIEEIAVLAGTDPVYGTDCDELQAAIIQVIKDHGGWWFYETTVYYPDFWYLQKELRACEDIVLLLAFVQEIPAGSGEYYIIGRHFVTLAGVDIFNLRFSISDPATPDGYDIYDVAWPSDTPCGFLWLPDYVADWPAFEGMNSGPCPIPPAAWNPAEPVYVEVEQAIVVSPGSKFINATVHSSSCYETENNKGGIIEFENDFGGETLPEATELYYGSLLLGTSQDSLACDYGDYAPLHTYEPLGPPVCDTFSIEGEAGTYLIEQCTYRFSPFWSPDLIITKYAFGFTVPAGGTEDCEHVVEDVYVLHNTGDNIIGLEKGVWLDYDVEPDYNDLSDGNAQYQSKWMWNPAATNRVYGLTKKPAVAGDVAVTGWGFIQSARVYDGQYMDSLKYWMENLGWGDDDPELATDRSIMIVDGAFDLLADEMHINKFLKWGYNGPIEPGGDFAWRTFLYNVLHQEGFYRGDANKDGKLDISDVIYMINYLFKGGPKPIEFTDQMDVNCDDKTDISDVIYTINYLFKGGPAPIDKNRFLLNSPFVDPLHKDLGTRVPGLFGDAQWTNLGKP